MFHEKSPVELKKGMAFFVNGKPYHFEKHGIDPRLTLLEFLRDQGLTGTKLGCGEGGCGACTVMLSKYDREKKEIRHISANACLTPICSMDGAAVTTVEGIGGMRKGLHPVQRRVAEMHGSQCGFCTPGIVMAIYSQLRMRPNSTPQEMEEALDGNLCRCTGYRPILDAAKSLSANKGGCCGGGGGSGGCPCKAESKGEQVVRNTCCSVHSLPSAEEEVAERALTEPIFPPTLMRYEPHSFHIEKDGCSWYQVRGLAELLEIKAQHPHARLVVGNTESHIEVKFKAAEYSVMVNPVHIPELQVLEWCNEYGSEGLRIGASVSLNALRTHIEHMEHTHEAYKMSGLIAIKHMLTWFASNHIRNVASVGGNLVTASPISDLNPMLLACGAKLKLVSLRGVRMVDIAHFFLGYRKVDLHPDEVVQDIFIPATAQHEYVLPFKQAKRREDDISIVTAGMRFKLRQSGNGWAVEQCWLSFGGMAVTSVLAKASSSLHGKDWSMTSIQTTMEALQKEFTLSVSVPGGKAEYRTSLVLSFLLKAFFSISLILQQAQPDLNILSPEDVSGADNYLTCDKPMSRGEQVFSVPAQGGMQKAHPVPTTPADADQQTRGVVGQPIMHHTAEAQVSGEAKYTMDMPLPANAVHACLVTSTRAHARLVSVDTSLAEQSSGFVAYFGAKDVVGSNHIGAIVKDEEVFAEDVVKCFGAVIGIVVANTHHEAVIAARRVKVTYEDLPAIISIDEAIAAGSFYPDHHELLHGDLEAEMANADVHVSGTCRMGGQEHFYLETNCTTASPIEGGMMEIYSSTQGCTKTQNCCALVCGLPASKVVSKCKRMGGGFGGKETRTVFIACTAALAAHLLDRPVSINVERDVDMSITGQRHAFVINYKAGCRKDGSLCYLQAHLFNNAGWSLDLSLPVMDRALFHSDNAYRWPALHAKGSVCRTNQPSHTAFRGFGGPQGMLLSETVLTHLAHALGKSPEEMRAKNLYKEGDITHFGMPLRYYYVPRLWKDIHSLADVSARRAAVDAFNVANRWKKRGLSVLVTKFGISFTAKFMNQGGALVHVYSDGSVLVAHGGTEMGQGLNTKVIQIAAQAFGISPESVFISETSTSTVANSSPTAASLSSDLYGMAVLDACEQISARLKPVRASMPSASWAEMVNSAYFQRINLSAQGFYIVPADRCGYDWSKSIEENARISTPFNYFTQGAACTEVEIDVLTGDSRVLRTDILMDVGKSLNPAIDIGQIEGAFMQGFGWSTLEEVVWGEKQAFPWVKEGQLFTRGPGTYKIPAFNDVPLDMRVHLADTDNRFAVHSSKAVGEPPFFLGASAFLAIKVTSSVVCEGCCAVLMMFVGCHRLLPQGQRRHGVLPAG